jgi:hypothetical protein
MPSRRLGNDLDAVFSSPMIDVVCLNAFPNAFPKALKGSCCWNSVTFGSARRMANRNSGIKGGRRMTQLRTTPLIWAF